ncbi:hypothetical protein [Pseudomonas sp. NBRC 111125]|uniref:hypothetical protein n=1 Tax=Pseudomonas sp. NBRC 111125 TaxID=1661040 RepID=UPI0007615F47|nr:hypothetical protein [Pseudomonas sp. NBRC 111125]
MKVNKRRLQLLISCSAALLMLAFLILDGGGYLLSEGRKDKSRLAEISDIESKTGRTVGDLGNELREYCEDMAQSEANKRIAAMASQAEKLEKILGYKSSTPNNYEREREEISNKTFSRCYRLSDVHGVSNLSYEVSEKAFREKITTKWIKLSFSTLFAVVLALVLSWIAGVFVVRAIPYGLASLYRAFKAFVSWITAPDK